MTEVLPFSAAAERNSEPIFSKLTELLMGERQDILEIGSGTGQHVAFFAARATKWSFQPSDRTPENFFAIQQRCQTLSNVLSPIQLDLISPPPLETSGFDIVLALNVFQVAPKKVVDSLYKLARHVLRPNGAVITYSPLTHGGVFTSPGDKAFHLRLQERNSELGIRSIESLQSSASQYGFENLKKYSMPANNWLTLARIP